MSTRLLTLYAEVVRDRRSVWQNVRIGRTWTTRPDEHDGRLLELRIRVPRDLLDDPPVIELDLLVAPEPSPLQTVDGSVEVHR